jgi:hypothetical protein
MDNARVLLTCRYFPNFHGLFVNNAKELFSQFSTDNDGVLQAFCYLSAKCE